LVQTKTPPLKIDFVSDVTSDRLTGSMAYTDNPMERVVKINVLLYDVLEFENMNAVYRKFFPKDPPARTTCGVQLSFGMKVEIECIALA